LQVDIGGGVVGAILFVGVAPVGAGCANEFAAIDAEQKPNIWFNNVPFQVQFPIMLRKEALFQLLVLQDGQINQPVQHYEGN